MSIFTGRKQSKMMTCPRCSGRGYLPEFSHVLGGQCFLCHGQKKVPTTFWLEPIVDFESATVSMDSKSGGLGLGVVALKVREDRINPGGIDSLGNPFKPYRESTFIAKLAKDRMDEAKKGNLKAAFDAAVYIAAFKGTRLGPSIKERALAYMEGSDLGPYFDRAVESMEGVVNALVERQKKLDKQQSDWEDQF